MEATPTNEEAARHSVFSRVPTFVPIGMLTLEQREELERNAATDNHRVVAPTHALLRSGEVIGYISHGEIPVVLAWFDSAKVKSSESVELLVKLEEKAMDKGYNHMALPCSDKSPYAPYLQKFGYNNLGYMNMFVRKLR